MPCSVVDLLTEPSPYEEALASSDDVTDPFLRDVQERARCKVAGGPLRRKLRGIASANLLQHLPPNPILPPSPILPPNPVYWLHPWLVPNTPPSWALLAGLQSEAPTLSPELRKMAAEAHETVANALRELADSLEEEGRTLSETS